MNLVKRVLVGIVIAAAFGACGYTAFRLLRSEYADAQRTPYQVDLSEFEQIPADLIRYDQVAEIGTGMKEPRGIAVGPQGDVYVAGDMSVAVFDAAGTEKKRFGLDAEPRCIAVGGDGTVYLGMERHVEVYAPSGERRAPWGSFGESAALTSVAAGGDDVFVADYGNRTIWRFDTSGALRGRIGRKDEGRGVPGLVIPSPFFDVAVGPGGSLWAANTGRLRVEEYTYEGDLKGAWGRASMEIDGFCGCCNPAHLALRSDGSFVTSEKGIVRVKVYDGSGVFRSVVAGPKAFSPHTVAADVAVDGEGRVLAVDTGAGIIRVFRERVETAEPPRRQSPLLREAS